MLCKNFLVTSSLIICAAPLSLSCNFSRADRSWIPTIVTPIGQALCKSSVNRIQRIFQRKIFNQNRGWYRTEAGIRTLSQYSTANTHRWHQHSASPAPPAQSPPPAPRSPLPAPPFQTSETAAAYSPGSAPSRRTPACPENSPSPPPAAAPGPRPIQSGRA